VAFVNTQTRLVSLGLLLVAVGSLASAAPVPLRLPQGIAFQVLGHSCGGIQEQAFVTGFDPASGYPVGDVYLRTTCSTGGRGSPTHTYTAWAAVTWDYTGAVVSDQALSAAPTVDPTFSAFDAYGNEIYDETNQAYLVLAPGFVPAPRVTGISTTSGPATGGTSVTIAGTGFTAATSVEFGTTAAASFTITSDTSITAIAPAASAGTVDVTVVSAGGASATTSADQFTFVAAPTVSSLSPNSGSVWGGTSVTITGANFSDATSVLFGDTGAGFTVDGDTSITAISPPGEAPDTVRVTVTSIGGTSLAGAAARFTYTSPPAITGVSPASGPVRGGETVDVIGTNLPLDATVWFGDAAATVVSQTGTSQIRAETPPGSAVGQTVDVSVSAFGGIATLANAYTYTANPFDIRLLAVDARAGGQFTIEVSGPPFGNYALAGSPGGGPWVPLPVAHPEFSIDLGPRPLFPVQIFAKTFAGGSSPRLDALGLAQVTGTIPANAPVASRYYWQAAAPGATYTKTNQLAVSIGP
jgi:IPT/TIG domain-containing protein